MVIKIKCDSTYFFHIERNIQVPLVLKQCIKYVSLCTQFRSDEELNRTSNLFGVFLVTLRKRNRLSNCIGPLEQGLGGRQTSSAMTSLFRRVRHLCRCALSLRMQGGRKEIEPTSDRYICRTRIGKEFYKIYFTKAFRKNVIDFIYFICQMVRWIDRHNHIHRTYHQSASQILSLKYFERNTEVRGLHR